MEVLLLISFVDEYRLLVLATLPLEREADSSTRAYAYALSKERTQMLDRLAKAPAACG